jgi:hypothetical protein
MIVSGGMVMAHVPYYLYGRLVTNNVSVNDTWELFLAKDPPVWERRVPVTRPPPPRRGHASVLFDADGKHPYTRMYVFGGYCEHEECPGLWYNDLWRLIVEKNEWQKVESWGDVPEARVGHSAACTNRDSFIVFGGGTLDTNENILYECYENGLWHRILPLHGTVPPSPRSYVTVVPVGLQLFMHGGCDNDRELDCLYSLSLDFSALLPRSLLSFLAEYIITNHIPYRNLVEAKAMEQCEEPRGQRGSRK